MWAIKYCPGYEDSKGEMVETYFKGSIFGMQEYCAGKKDAMKFKNKRDAEAYIRVMLSSPEKHHAVRIRRRDL